ncbi:ODFP1 protein, partial [Calyptomena viridis]|nr:ODFP1 protein [Calyptomena viridis]
SRTHRFCKMLSACRHRNHLALVDVLGFDPCDVTVMVKDGKVTVSAEHEHECNTSMSKTYKYKKLVKEFDLPPGVCEDEVTCCL